MKDMQASQKLPVVLLLLGCIAYSLFFPDPGNTALIFVLYACILMYLFSKREQSILFRIKFSAVALLFSILMTALFITAAELIRGYFILDSVFMGVMMCLALGALIMTLFLILQEILPEIVQVLLLVLAGLYLINIGTFAYTLRSTLSDVGVSIKDTQYTLPWNLLGIALGILAVEAALFAGVHKLRIYFQNR